MWSWEIGYICPNPPVASAEYPTFNPLPTGAGALPFLGFAFFTFAKSIREGEGGGTKGVAVAFNIEGAGGAGVGGDTTEAVVAGEVAGVAGAGGGGLSIAFTRAISAFICAWVGFILGGRVASCALVSLKRFNSLFMTVGNVVEPKISWSALLRVCCADGS